MSRKFKFFLIRNFSVLSISSLALVSVILSLIMGYLHQNYRLRDLINISMLTGDMLIPLIFFIIALIFRSRYFAVGAVLACFINIFLRLTAVIMYYHSFMALDYNSIKLLAIHTDFESVGAIFGKYYYLWLVPVVIAVIVLISYCCIWNWKTIKFCRNRCRKNALIISAILLFFSILSCAAFHIYKEKSQVVCIAGRPLPIAVYHLAKETADNSRNDNQYKPIPIPENSRDELVRMKVLAPAGELVSKQDLFDKIIIIAVESLDYEYFNCHNPEMPKGITPNLDRMSKQYVSMKNYFPGSHPTSWALTSLILSRMDYERDKYISNESIFTAARKKGFYSYYFTSASGDFGENSRFYKVMFQADVQMFRKEFHEKYNVKLDSSWGFADRKLYSCILDELKKSPSKRFIAVISTMDTHYPYFNSPLSPEEEKVFQTPFLRALYSTDRELNTFITNVMKDPALYNDRTLIIITADHTATLGENYTRRADFYPARIPLIFITPNQKIFQKINTEKYASSIDLAPTLLDLINVEIPASFMGRSLFSDKNLAMIMPYYPYMIVHSEKGEKRFFLDDAESPRETALRDFFYSHYGDK